MSVSEKSHNDKTPKSDLKVGVYMNSTKFLNDLEAKLEETEVAE